MCTGTPPCRAQTAAKEGWAWIICDRDRDCFGYCCIRDGGANVGDTSSADWSRDTSHRCCSASDHTSRAHNYVSCYDRDIWTARAGTASCTPGTNASATCLGRWRAQRGFQVLQMQLAISWSAPRGVLPLTGKTLEVSCPLHWECVNFCLPTPSVFLRFGVARYRVHPDPREVMLAAWIAAPCSNGRAESARPCYSAR